MQFSKFLWWGDIDTTKEITDYEMTAHVFDGSLSLSCSNFTLTKTAMDNEGLYGKDIATFLERNFYVDMLKSFSTAEEAITVIQQVKDLCSNGGFNLTKFISNNTTAFKKSIPDDSRRRAVKDE